MVRRRPDPVSVVHGCLLNAEDAKVTQKPQKEFLQKFFCDFCVTFATSAFLLLASPHPQAQRPSASRRPADARAAASTLR